MNLGSPYAAAEFRDNFGRDRSGYLVSHLGRNYYAKVTGQTDDAERDRLGYALSRGVCNVPEVVTPRVAERQALLALLPSNGEFGSDGPSIHLVRLCQDYAGAPMTVPTLDAAIAAELVFSLWIKRRDAHNGNRVYNNGVPMFFDFGVAFDTYPRDGFDYWPGPGYVPNWRLVELPEGVVVTTQAIRMLEVEGEFALQPVQSIERFWQEAERARDAILAMPDDAIRQTVASTIGDPERAGMLADWLLGRMATLAVDVERLRTMLVAIPYEALGVELGVTRAPA